MKRHEIHFDKSRVVTSLRTEVRAHRRNTAVRYRPEGRWFDFRWDHWGFSLNESFLWSTHPLTEMSTRIISWG